MGGDLKYELLCPIGRKTKARHHHGSNKDTNFYHSETSGQGTLTIMFARTNLDDERTLVYPLSVNYSMLPSWHDWELSNPMDVERAAKEIAQLLAESRMIVREVER